MGILTTFAQFAFDTGTARWRSLAGGQFAAERAVSAELTRHSDAAQQTLQELTRSLYRGDVTVGEWERAVAMELKDAHLAHSMFARGGVGGMDAVSYGRVGGNLGDEFNHLREMADGIANGDVTEAQALARIRQYGNASQQSYWKEWGVQRDRPEWAGLPALNQAPRDGRTRCHGNCTCTLEERDDGIHWILGATENHCTDCPGLAAGSPYRPGNV